MVLEDTLAPTHAPYEVGRFVLQTIFFIFSTSGGPFIWNSQLSIHARSRKNGPPWEIFARVFLWTLDGKSEVGKKYCHIVSHSMKS